MIPLAANFSDFSGATNPTGIWSPAFVALKLALDRADRPDNVLQLLYDWLSQRKITPVQVDKILDLPSMEAAYDALIGLVGGSLSPKALPPAVQQTVQRAIQRLAQKYVERGEQELDQARQRFTSIRGRYGVESARQLVRRLLSS